MSLLSKVAVSAIALAAFAGPAAAQQPASQPSEPVSTVPDVSQVSTGSHIYVSGAIRDPADRSAPVAEDTRVPELPVVYEEAKAPTSATTRAAAALPASRSS